MHRAVREQAQDGGELPRNARRLDSQVGSVFGQVQDLGAVGEQRGASLPKIQTPGVDFSQRGDQAGGCLALGGGAPPHVLQQFGIRQQGRGRKSINHTYL